MKNRIVPKILAVCLASSLLPLGAASAGLTPPDETPITSEFVSAEGDFYVYQNGRLKAIVRPDGWTIMDPILSFDKSAIVDFTLLDPRGNLVAESGITARPELARMPLYPRDGGSEVL